MTDERFPHGTIEQKATVPPTEFFIPDSTLEQQNTSEFLGAIQPLGPHDAVIITHNDADGLTSGAFLKHWFEATHDGIAVVYPTSYYEEPAVADLLHYVSGTSIGSVVVSDLGASEFTSDAENAIEHIEQLDRLFAWIDHHQWDDDALDTLTELASSTVIDDSECATSLVVQARNGDRDAAPFPVDTAPDAHVALADVVKDHDIWIKEDDRSDRIAIYAEYADNDAYMDAVLTHGVDVLEEYNADIADYEKTNQVLRERGVDEAVVSTVGTLTVAVTYGYGPSSSVGNDLVERNDADLAVVIRPDSSLSFYAHSSEEEFARCHDVAAEFNGGGHPTAAGGNLGLETFDEFVSLWSSEGAAYHDSIRDAVQSILE